MRFRIGHSYFAKGVTNHHKSIVQWDLKKRVNVVITLIGHYGRPSTKKTENGEDFKFLAKLTNLSVFLKNILHSLAIPLLP